MEKGQIAVSFAVAALCLYLVACDPNAYREYYVVYDGNGHTAGTLPATRSYAAGTVVTAAEVVPSFVSCPQGVEGRCFDAWNTAPDGGGTEYPAGNGTFIMTGNLTLYAQWKEYALGDIGPAGGSICFVKSEFSDGWRFLEGSPSGTGWSSKPWGGYGTPTTTGTEVGDGPPNTQAIVETYGALEPHQGKPDYAAKLCSDLVYGGYSDWFLPSLDELVLVCSAYANFAIGEYDDVPYWSSSGDPGDLYASWYVEFSSGSIYKGSKDIGLFVRAVRRF